MALYADGGLVGSKPYAAGGNYIKKMGDYCDSCQYNVKLRTGEGACPLNSLYWHFMARHKDRFQGNHRMRMLYGTWNKMGDETQRAVLDQAEHYLNTIEQLRSAANRRIEEALMRKPAAFDVFRLKTTNY